MIFEKYNNYHERVIYWNHMSLSGTNLLKVDLETYSDLEAMLVRGQGIYKETFGKSSSRRAERA